MEVRGSELINALSDDCIPSPTQTDSDLSDSRFTRFTYLSHRDLEHVDEASFASKDRSTGTNACLPQTQISALQTIGNWVISETDSPLFWLRGSAGSGKSTIAYTIAQEWSHSGASFFFSRARLSLRESRLVFQTIAFQLRINYPILMAPISCALDQGILTADGETQLRKLILDPILQTQAHLPKRLVIVIDALDECDDNVIVNVVKLLATTLEQSEPSVRIRLRFLVTSRPEEPLVKFFRGINTPSFDMSTINPDDKEKDIHIFLKNELQTLANSTSYEVKENDIRLLAKISDGVFIAARIAVDFVAFGSPNSQLQQLHNAGHISGLDVVYQVLATTTQESSIWDIRQPIGTIVLSFAPLSKQALTDLLHIGTGERLDQLLHALRAVIHVREGDAIYPIHASLRDYLTDPNRCTDPRVFVHPAHHHGMISRACFDRMASLLQMSDVRNLCRGWKKLLPGDLTYASQFWARHLAESNIDQSLVCGLHDFTSIRLLYWIECLSFIRDLDLGVSGLGVLLKVLVRSEQVPDQIIALLSDAHWFLQHFEDLLLISPMYTYSAALQLTPTTTKIYQQYASKFEGMALHLKLTREWDKRRQRSTTLV